MMETLEDLIWGNVIHVVEPDTVDVHITYQPSINRHLYQTHERVQFVKREALGFDQSVLPDDEPGSRELMGRNLLLRVVERDALNNLRCEVSLVL